MPIGVGCGPSGPSIEGLFCCTVYLCLALGDKKIETKIKKIRSTEVKTEKKRERSKKKKKIREIYFIFYVLLSF